MAELKNMPGLPGNRIFVKQAAKLLKSFSVFPETWWELPEHNTQFLLQFFRPVKEFGEGFLDVLQPFGVGDEPVSFDSKGESWGSGMFPVGKSFGQGKAVEGDIKFHGGKL